MGLLNFESIPGLFFEYKPGEQETALALVQTMAHQEASFTEANVDASPLTYEEVCRLVAALERTNARHLNIGRDDRSRVFNKHPGDETLFHPDTKAINMDAMVAEGARDHGIYVYNKTMWKDQWRKTVDDFVPRVDGSHTGRLVWSNAMDLKIIAATGSKVKLDTEYCGYAWTKASSGKKRCDENRGKTTSLKGAIDESARRVEEADGDDPDESERRFYVMLASDIIKLSRLCRIDAARVINVVYVCEAYVAFKRRTGRRRAGANYAPAGQRGNRKPWQDMASCMLTATMIVMEEEGLDYDAAWDRAGLRPATDIFQGDAVLLNIAEAYKQVATLRRTAHGVFSEEHAMRMDADGFDWDRIPASYTLAAMSAHGGRSTFPGSAALIESAASIRAFPAANPELPRAARLLFEREHARQSASNASRRLAAAKQRRNTHPATVAKVTQAAELAHFGDLNPLLPIAAVRLAAVLSSEGGKTARRRRRHEPVVSRRQLQLASIRAFTAANPELPRAARLLFEREHARQSASNASRRLAAAKQRRNTHPATVAKVTQAAELAHFGDLNPLLPIAAVRLAAVLVTVKGSKCTKVNGKGYYGKGYSWNNATGSWYARTTIAGKRIFLGSYSIEGDAARAVRLARFRPLSV